MTKPKHTNTNSHQNDRQDNNQHWSQIRENGSELGMKILLTAHRYGGRVLFKILLFPVMIYYFARQKQARIDSLAFLHRVRTKVPLKGHALWLSFRHFWSFACTLLDKITLLAGGIKRDSVNAHNIELLRDCLERGQGALLITSHLGNFEACRALSITNQKIHMTVLVHTEHAEKFNKQLKRFDNNANVRLMQTGSITPATAMDLSERLGNGEFVAIAGDRSPAGNEQATTLCDFLGDKAAFPTGPYILASTLKAPVFMVTGLRNKTGFDIYFDSLSDTLPSRKERSAWILKTAQQYAQRLERYTLQAPLQWFNFFDFWQQPAQKRTATDSTDVTCHDK